MIIKSKPIGAVTLVLAFFTVVMAGLFLGGAAYVCCQCVRKAKSIERARARQLVVTNEFGEVITNDLAESSWLEAHLPEQDEWIISIPGDATVECLDGELSVTMSESNVQLVFDSVAQWQISTTRTLRTWGDTGQSLLADSNAVRDLLLDAARADAAVSPSPSSGFYRMARLP